MPDPVNTLRDWLAEHPPRDTAFRQSLAAVAGRARAGEDFQTAVRELLDEFELLPADRLRRRAIQEKPQATGEPRHDAYLGALAEHLAATHGLERPRWACDPERFLDRFWFVSEVPGFRAIAIAQSPAAFRRRGIMIARNSLSRV